MTAPILLGIKLMAMSLNAMALTAIAQTSAVQIVDCLVEGTLIAVFAGAVLGLARRQNSGTRFAVWFSALMAIAALPFVSAAAWPHAGISAGVAGTAAVTLPSSWALYAIAAWAAIAGWLLAGVARGLWHLHVLRKSCVPVDVARLDDRVRQTLDRAERRVKLCKSDRVSVPTVVGFANPVILVPGWVMQELSAGELNQVVLHELAHLRRWDDWTNLAQKVVRALFFFHPAVWWIERKMSLEREMACDDAVIAQTESPRAYAECLTHLAEKTLMQRGVALAQAALGRIRQTSLRVAQILDGNRPSAGRAWRPAVTLVAGFAVVCVVGISRAPRLIAFSDGQTVAASRPAIARLQSDSPIANVPATKAVFREQNVGAVPTSLHTGAAHRKQKADAVATPAKVYNASVRDNDVRRAQVQATQVQPTDVRLPFGQIAPAAYTETLFVVFENGAVGSTGRRVFQIQMWRVMVLHPVVDSDSNKLPAKQT
ncbi:MAG TPA: M56 family metallopeptidase [Candidatus Sulfotelmatobacter sp.]|nr:M56 family metallopeptidase [Candidatus Sulfotelmatobacter sp.]